MTMVSCRTDETHRVVVFNGDCWPRWTVEVWDDLIGASVLSVVLPPRLGRRVLAWYMVKALRG